MKQYILGRVIRSVLSVMAVVSIVILMVYLMIPQSKVFKNDSILIKLAGKPDEIAVYKNTKLEDLGYLDFVQQQDLCRLSEDYDRCMEAGSAASQELKAEYEKKGYVFEEFTNGLLYATRSYLPHELVLNFFANFIQIDSPNQVIDDDNPDLERKIYIEKDYNGVPAIQCSGCNYQYLVYFDSSFPFIHQNWITLNFGISYPTYSGLDTWDVISSGQGELDTREVVYETGQTGTTAMNLHACQYKPSATIDHLDQNKFNSNYANCANNYKSPSMINMSYIIGGLGLLLAYLISIPAGIYMARKKDQWPDKLGTVYINFMIAVPSLAFIFFARQIGYALGLPDKFPQYGFTDLRSYVMPVIVLALLSTASLMIWTRRYMVDQSNSDYVKFAKAKGLSQKEIFNRHILRNAIIPIVQGIPSSIILCISGSVITESVFSIPGMGKMLPDAIKANNISMVITLTFIFTALSVFALLIGDLLITKIDPRIKLSSKGGSR